MAKTAQRALLWISIFAVAVGALALGWYIHLNASEWEPTLTVAGALIALLGVLGWWRGPRGLRWLAAGLGWIGYFSALVFALFHGWSFVLPVAILIPMIVFQVVLSSRLARLRRAVIYDTFAVPPELALEASWPATLNPHEDIDAEKVYPVRARLLRLALGCAVLVAMFTGTALFFVANQNSLRSTLGLACCVFLVPYFASIVIASLIQLVHPRPLLTIRHDGIVNTSGTFGDGPGLVRWREIVGMYIRGPRSSWLSRRLLVVLVANPRALVARQSLFNRAVQRLYAVDRSSPVVIPERVLPMTLPMTLEELQDKMLPFLKRAHGDDWGDEAEGSEGAIPAQD